ncbi:MAG TPA: TraB/GumN family protein [Kofleriaceae bacterium]|nr:TraB/GumN family protein [Kofleriaceae bacterium]
MRRRLSPSAWPAWLAVALATLWALAGCKHESSKPPPASGSAATTGPQATGPDPWASKTPAAPLIERPLMWAATKDGHTTYLLGTLHLGINADTQLPAWVKQKLDDARVFAMEADVHDPGLLSALKRTDGGSLRLELGPDYWKKLEDVLGADLANGFDKLKPFAVMSMLEAHFLPTTLPMDAVLEARAKEKGKPVIYFESALRQLEIVEPFMTAPDVKAYLDKLDYAKAQSAEMLDAYQRGDDATLGKQFEDQTLWIAAGRDPAQFDGFVKALLANRNETWIPQLEKINDEGGGFVAVGAGHLVGPGNVLGMLAARGFTVTRVTGDTTP